MSPPKSIRSIAHWWSSAIISPSREGTPLAAYAYLYLNEPDFFYTNMTLRLAIAPVYVDSELGFRHLLGPNTDLAFGLAGGGFADDYYEIHNGNYFRDQSFLGHVAETTVSIYHLFNPGDRIPLSGVFRVQEHYSIYARDDTAPTFVLPHDHSTFKIRSGLRWGQARTSMHPDLAMELEARVRSAVSLGPPVRMAMTETGKFLSRLAIYIGRERLSHLYVSHQQTIFCRQPQFRRERPRRSL